MKTNNFTKISMLVLMLVLLVGAMFAMNVSAAETETGPVIISQNIRYQGDFALMFAVQADTVTSGSVTIEIYDHNPTSASTPIDSYTVSDITSHEGTNLTVDFYQITTKGVAAIDMTKQYYVKAIDGDKESAVMRYSVAEYLYERLANPASTAEQKNLYNAVIHLGDCAQVVITPEVDETPVSNYRLVTVTGGTIGGFSQGVYPIDGDPLTPVVAGGTVDKWTVISYDDEGKAETYEIGAGESFVVKGRTEVSSGEVQSTVKAGTLDFESYTVGGALPNAELLQLNAACNGAIANESVYENKSNILKVSYLSSAGEFHVFKTEDENAISADNAKAFEFSFDIKLDTIGDTDKAKSIGFSMRAYSNNEQGSSQNLLQANLSVANGRLLIEGEDVGNAYEYNRVTYKMIIKPNNLIDVIIYVNGSVVNDTKYVDFTRNNTFTISEYSEFTKWVIRGSSTLTDTLTFNFDNVYCGYSN